MSIFSIIILEVIFMEFSMEKKFPNDVMWPLSGKELDASIIDMNSPKDLFKELELDTLNRGALGALAAMYLMKKIGSVNSLIGIIADYSE